jgi:hypothetical protein
MNTNDFELVSNVRSATVKNNYKINVSISCRKIIDCFNFDDEINNLICIKGVITDLKVVNYGGSLFTKFKRIVFLLYNFFIIN